MRVIKYSLTAAALTFAFPALAQTAKTYSPECAAQAIAEFRSAWQQDAGNPYYGPDSSIIAQYATQVSARACEARKASVPVAVPDAAALAAARKEGATAVKASVTAALGGF